MLDVSKESCMLSRFENEDKFKKSTLFNNIAQQLHAFTNLLEL